MAWSVTTILRSDLLHFLWGLFWLGPFCLILTIFSRRFTGRGVTIITFVAARELHVLADKLPAKLWDITF